MEFLKPGPFSASKSERPVQTTERVQTLPPTDALATNLDWSKGLSRNQTIDIVETLHDLGSDFFTLGESLRLEASDIKNYYQGSIEMFVHDWKRMTNKATSFEPLKVLAPAKRPQELIEAEIRYQVSVPATNTTPAHMETSAIPMLFIPGNQRRRLQHTLPRLWEENLNYAQRYCRHAIRWAIKEEQILLQIQEQNLQRVLLGYPHSQPTKTVGLAGESFVLRTLGLEYHHLTLTQATIEKLTADLALCGPIIATAKKEDFDQLVKAEPLNKIFEGLDDGIYDGVDLKYLGAAKFNHLRVRAEMAPEINLLERLARYEHPLQPAAAEFAKTLEIIKTVEHEVTRDKSLDDQELEVDDPNYRFA